MNSLFVEPAGLGRLTASLSEAHRSPLRLFEDVAYGRKSRVISSLFAGEMQDLGAHLAIAGGGRSQCSRPESCATSRKPSSKSPPACACIGRTLTPSTVRPADFAVCPRRHVRKREERNPNIDPLVYDFVERVLTLRFKRWMPRSDARTLVGVSLRAGSSSAARSWRKAWKTPRCMSTTG